MDKTPRDVQTKSFIPSEGDMVVDTDALGLGVDNTALDMELSDNFADLSQLATPMPGVPVDGDFTDDEFYTDDEPAYTTDEEDSPEKEERREMNLRNTPQLRSRADVSGTIDSEDDDVEDDGEDGTIGDDEDDSEDSEDDEGKDKRIKVTIESKSPYVVHSDNALTYDNLKVDTTSGLYDYGNIVDEDGVVVETNIKSVTDLGQQEAEIPQTLNYKVIDYEMKDVKDVDIDKTLRKDLLETHDMWTYRSDKTRQLLRDLNMNLMSAIILGRLLTNMKFLGLEYSIDISKLASNLV